MQIEIKIDPTCEETKVIVMTDKVTDEVNMVIQKLSEETPQVLAGFKEDVVEVLEQSEIIRFYALSGKIFAVTSHGEYSLRRRLYELEEMLNKRDFVRISNSEIINLKKAKGFDLSFVGTICVTMTNGDVVYVSRRYVSKIKQVLGL